MAQNISIESFQTIENKWGKIVRDCTTDTVFSTPWWLRTWWNHFGDDAEALIMSVHSGESIIGIAPMMNKNGVLTFLGDANLCDYGDFLPTRNSECEFYRSLFDYLPLLNWHTIELKSIPQASPTLRHIPELAKEKGFTTEMRQEDVTPTASLPDTWHEYVDGLTKKHRHELRRKFRRIEEAGMLNQTICQTPDTLAESMPDFFRLHRASNPDKAEFMTPPRERFFLDTAMEFGARNQFRLGFLELNGTRVATYAVFDYIDSHLLYNSGYDPHYSKLSVGVVCKAMAIKAAIQEGKSRFNFLRGAELYKYHLGGKDFPLYQLTIRR